MVALLVVLTIIVCLVVDWVQQLIGARRARLQVARAGLTPEAIVPPRPALPRDPSRASK